MAQQVKEKNQEILGAFPVINSLKQCWQVAGTKRKELLDKYSLMYSVLAMVDFGLYVDSFITDVDHN